MHVHHGSYPALLLNADFSPVSLFPLSTLSWQDAIKAVCLDRVVPVAEYDVEVASARSRHRLPSVVALREYVKVPRLAAFTRTNIWLRDGGRCAYCKVPLATHEVTFDHVMPRSRGGTADWDNIVCSCSACNCRKGNRTPEECGLSLSPPPKRPAQLELARSARLLGKSSPAPRDWLDFLYWEAELERG